MVFVSVTFSFTEWLDKIKKLNKKKFILENWFFMNSLHIVDLVFNLIGNPKKLYSISNRKHPPFRNSIFLGAGISKEYSIYLPFKLAICGKMVN